MKGSRRKDKLCIEGFHIYSGTHRCQRCGEPDYLLTDRDVFMALFKHVDRNGPEHRLDTKRGRLLRLFMK